MSLTLESFQLVTVGQSRKGKTRNALRELLLISSPASETALLSSAESPDIWKERTSEAACSPIFPPLVLSFTSETPMLLNNLGNRRQQTSANAAMNAARQPIVQFPNLEVYSETR